MDFVRSFSANVLPKTKAGPHFFTFGCWPRDLRFHRAIWKIHSQIHRLRHCTASVTRSIRDSNSAHATYLSLRVVVTGQWCKCTTHPIPSPSPAPSSRSTDLKAKITYFQEGTDILQTNFTRSQHPATAENRVLSESSLAWLASTAWRIKSSLWNCATASISLWAMGVRFESWTMMWCMCLRSDRIRIIIPSYSYRIHVVFIS